MKTVEPSSRSMAIQDIISIGSFVEVLVLNHYVLVRKILCGDPNHLIGECPKPSKDKNQIAFVGGSWSNSDEEEDEKVKNETCLVAQASSEICLGVDLEPDE
nr:alpha/beta hydrolases superfamily protein [Tanacetum cinerariifolium]